MAWKRSKSRDARLRRFRLISDKVAADFEAAMELVGKSRHCVRQWIEGINAPNDENLEKLEAKYADR